MINVQLYRYNGESNTLNKVLDAPFTLTGSFYSEINILRPIIVFRGFDVQQYNYCYIEQLGRYYFIDNITLNDNNDSRVIMSLDILKSYENVILDAEGTIIESSNANKYISTRTNIYDKRPKFEVLEFEEDLFVEDGEIIMITIKGD